MARPLKREKKDTKSMVLHAASKLFIERGYSNIIEKLSKIGAKIKMEEL